MKVWILTREINMYDQDGAYFVAVYGTKPTEQELLEEGVHQSRINHVLNGGGRLEYEDEWFYLDEVCPK